jgi:hypothetical protein
MYFKRGQVSLFIIITLLIVILILSFGLFKNLIRTEESKSVLGIENRLLTCFEDNFILRIDSFGRLYNLNYGEVFYYYEEGFVNIPSIDFFEREFIKISEEVISECIILLNDSDLNRNINHTLRSIDINIKESSIQGTLNLDLYISNSEIVYHIDINKKPLIFDSDFYTMHEFSMFFADYLRKNEEWIPISESLDFCKLRGIDFYYEEEFNYKEIVVYLVSKKEFTPKSFVFYNKLNYHPPIEGELFL